MRNLIIKNKLQCCCFKTAVNIGCFFVCLLRLIRYVGFIFSVFHVKKATCIRGSNNKTADHFELCINTLIK